MHSLVYQMVVYSANLKHHGQLDIWKLVQAQMYDILLKTLIMK